MEAFLARKNLNNTAITSDQATRPRGKKKALREMKLERKKEPERCKIKIYECIVSLEISSETLSFI